MGEEGSLVAWPSSIGCWRILIALVFGESALMLRKKILERFGGRELNDSAFRAKTHYEIGMKLANQANYVLALGEFKHAVELHPDFAEAHLELGSTYRSLDRLDEAVEAYSEALRIRPDYVEAYTNLGIAYDCSAQFVKALKMYMKAIRLRPEDIEIRKNLGLAYFNVGSYREAIKAYKQALEINPEDGPAHYYLGLVHLDLNDKESAMEQQRKLKELGLDDVASLLMDEIQRQVWKVARTPATMEDARTPSILNNPTTVDKERGFSAIELLIVVAIVAVVCGFALIQITRARQMMVRENTARLFAARLEKARLDSVRRRPPNTNTAQMAQVSIINSNFYSVTIDSDGDGTLNAPQVFNLPENTTFELTVPFPWTIYFNWRGRTVDAAGALASPTFVNISNTGLTRIDLTSAGQPTLDGPPTSSPVANSSPSPPNFRTNTQVP